MVANGPALRLLPRLDDDNHFFWTSGEDGQLRFLRCRACENLIHPPTPRCPYCLAEYLVPEVVSGHAIVESFTVNLQQWIPGSDPYIVGLVSMVEQSDVRLMTNLVDVEPDDVHIGMEVEVVFEHNDDVYLPLFRPVRTAS
jgi:uncharacterized protein